MTIEAITDALKADPFHPFRIYTSSGRHYDVSNPSLVVPMKNRLFVALDDLDHSAMISYLHITSIETLNGQAKRKSPRRRGGR